MAPDGRVGCQMTEERRCGIRLPHVGVCNRLISDPCGYCRVYDAHKEQWAEVFEELQGQPRVAVDGDI